ncbi:2-oxo acid dehydrogenase subunit E2 [Ornithinimicrobium ciconiae]|nr:2-oxo acid dehydrogenase subunit E2 [Ornithinimicrobium ciconiae]
MARRKVTQLSFIFDHRVCDGGTAGGFLRYVADCVNAPSVSCASVSMPSRSPSVSSGNYCNPATVIQASSASMPIASPACSRFRASLVPRSSVVGCPGGPRR